MDFATHSEGVVPWEQGRSRAQMHRRPREVFQVPDDTMQPAKKAGRCRSASWAPCVERSSGPDRAAGGRCALISDLPGSNSGPENGT